MPSTALPPSAAPRNGAVSFWYAATGLPPRRAPLPGPREADVCIVGGGYTGLWTAYYLLRADPALRVVVLEREFCGYGASGRNGGWVTAALAGTRTRFAATHGREGVVALQRAMEATVDEVLRVAREEGVDCDAVKGGELTVARTPAQLARLRAAVAEDHAWGATDHVLLDADETARRVRVEGALGGSWTPHCARVQPAKLVRGLAAVVEGLGAAVHESTPVTRVEPGRAVTPYGDVVAPVVLRATEGFTARLPGLRRTWLPMNSSMVVTAPLGDARWAAIGWDGCETLGDAAHAYVYAQRTADGRIALGGRGVPYRYASRTDADGATPATTVRQLQGVLARMFPAAADVPLEHAWSGVLAVPRDWCSTAGLDPRTGLGWAGGYVGHGVATANLAGRTLRDLALAHLGGGPAGTALTRLPWVGRRVRGWEPEPLRWLGVQALYAAYRSADRLEEARGGSTSTVARVADVVSGRH
ncbi:NAD(P)/FAD-dependent oxidoreductase [Vallicoccus soli]|uniref:NAD(P)/FAD-dependent oxidoreductase n=1 Tax=Vallicoccus soli TaxID=2339232 RepID=UPI001C499591|nr:FAD-dependent oxidoreductase [Vallicoccus soli]